MELIIVMRVLTRRWWIILIPVLVASALAIPDLIRNEQTAAGGFQTHFQYSAAQETSNIPTRDGDYQDVWLASEYVVNAFTDWVRSSSFREELAIQVGDENLLNGLNIASDNSRSIGTVYMSHPNGETLEKLANAAIVILQTRNQVYFPHLGDTAADVTIIDLPTVLPAAAPLTNRFAPVLQIGVALFAGLILAALAEYFDPTLRYIDELESQGLKVLATIPKHK
jgi:capsular polysaccharide biosynthesis protein